MFSINYQVEKSILVNTDIENLYNYVGDFKQWPKWSPWLYVEPTAKYEVLNNSFTKDYQQNWDGQFIGSGKMVLTDFKKNEFLKYDLFFLKPWKSYSKTEFIFENKNGSTLITWKMKGSLPLFIFFFKKMMMAFIGHDFIRGLKMLKEQIETGTLNSRMEIKGETQIPEFYFFGKRIQCSINEISQTMSKTFDELNQLSASKKISEPTAAVSFNHKFDMVTGECDLTVAFTYKSKPTLNCITLDSNWVSGFIESHKAYQVDHFGSYIHLANGWSAAMNRQRMLKLKLLKSIAPYELYLTKPGTSAEKDIITSIVLPIK